MLCNITPLRLAAAALACLAAASALADVLPEDRADASWRTYDGGGLKVEGPAVLVRKGFEDTVSVSAGYLVDRVSGASIDMVMLGASPLHEVRKQKQLGVDYLYGKTTYSAGIQESIENDYDSSTLNVAISQSMFGDLTTVTIGVSRGWDIVTKVINAAGQKDPNFRKRADRKTWSLGVSQILTRNWLAGFDYEAITEQGYLQNPYRAIRYLAAPGSPIYLTGPETYPGTRTSNAAAARLKYYLPWRASLTGRYRYFFDTWDIHAHTFELDYTQPFLDDSFIADLTYRYYTQNSASFYSDLFQYANQQNYMARDKELAAQDNNAVGAALSYDFLKSKHWVLKKASGSLHYDYIMYKFRDFRDATQRQLPAGTEPMYHYNASVVQAFFSIWF
ncbi:MAG TPA: DUF3570 domain-containing protein [Steroidobacteraceae bacterium]|nr:DUF3570 domain-containing protein [Steroidobacteraceae bacterium]